MGKRANGEGSVYRRKSDGRWVGSLSLPDGTRKVLPRVIGELHSSRFRAYQALTPQQVQAFYAKKLSDGLSPKTINNIHGLLHKALSNAVKWNILPRNVCDAVTPPRIPRKEKTVLTIEQAYTLLRQIKNHRMEALFTLAMVTGMRRGELLACLICAFTIWGIARRQSC